MRKRFCVLLVLALFFTAGSNCAADYAADSVSASAEWGVFSVPDGAFIRPAGDEEEPAEASVSASLSGLKQDEYISFSFRVTGLQNAEESRIRIRVDGGESVDLQPYAREDAAVCYFLPYPEMQYYGPGSYLVSLYLDGRFITSRIFTITEKENPGNSDSQEDQDESGQEGSFWSGKISIPSQEESRSLRTEYCSPQIRCSPFLADFRADHLPNGTTVCICCWDMDLSSLTRSGAAAVREYDGFAAYASFQVLSDGRRAAVLCIGDTWRTDREGNTSVIRAELKYPDESETLKFSQNGNFARCVVPFDWKEKQWYRVLIQLDPSPSGTQTVSFSVRDLSVSAWKKLAVYDTGLTGTFMTAAFSFMENTSSEYAGDVRSVRFSKYRVRSSETGRWTGAASAQMRQDGHNPGSYGYGSSGNSFWAVTTAIPFRCRKPVQNQFFFVAGYEADDPY